MANLLIINIVSFKEDTANPKQSITKNKQTTTGNFLASFARENVFEIIGKIIKSNHLFQSISADMGNCDASPKVAVFNPFIPEQSPYL